MSKPSLDGPCTSSVTAAHTATGTRPVPAFRGETCGTGSRGGATTWWCCEEGICFEPHEQEGAGADHLKALARVSRLLRDKSVCEKLRGADQTDAIYALLTDTAKSHAA